MKAGESVDPALAARLSDYMRTAMGARLDSSGKNITLAISPGIQNGFSADVSGRAPY